MYVRARYNMLENLNVMHLKSWHYARLILVYMFDTLFFFPSPQTKAYLHKSEHKVRSTELDLEPSVMTTGKP